MAPPPPASMPLGQRLMQLAETLQFGWFIGHVTLLLCTLRYGISYLTLNSNTRWARYSYRTAFVAAAATYGIVVYKAYRARARAGKGQQGGMLSLAADENVQYLAMALVWLFARQVPLALLPYAVYSGFHTLVYIKGNILPVIQGGSNTSSPGGKPTSPIADSIGRIVKKYYDPSMSLVAGLEIFLWFRILFSAIIFTKGSWVLLFFYTIFFRARYSQSSFVQGAISQGVQKIDALLADQSVPPVIRQGWGSVKALSKQAVDATDIQKYIGAQQQGSGTKKAQ